MKVYFFIFFVLFVLGVGFFIGNKQRVFQKCPKSQVLINNECFTPGVYYTSGLPR